LKNKTQRFNRKNSENNKEASQRERPFSRCTFQKEVNTLARKARKKGALGVYASALKRQQDKESKTKVAKSVVRLKMKIPLRRRIPCQSTTFKNESRVSWKSQSLARLSRGS
jgi:hypothetical protein